MLSLSMILHGDLKSIAPAQYVAYYGFIWVALSRKTRKVIATAHTLKRAIQNAQKKGEQNPIMQKM